MKTFADYKENAHLWITLSTGEYYPDILPRACELYKPVLVLFSQLLQSAHSSTDLFMAVSDVHEQWMRIQLCRVFRKYVSPDTSVEMLKKKGDAQKVCERFGKRFRPITEVQQGFSSRPMPDEALCAILWEYKDRGKKGYDLTERLFSIIRERLAKLEIRGPERAGKDILMGTVFPDYPNPGRPVDFAIYKGRKLLALGLAHYDSDRGGSQEDRGPGDSRDFVREALEYTDSKRLRTKLILLNDGPGLLLGSMWNDHAQIERIRPSQVRVVTLRMVPERITVEWLRS
jgi:hypothetical protein